MTGERSTSPEGWDSRPGRTSSRIERVIVGDTTLAVPTDSTTGRLTVRVGQVIYLQADGICTRSVSANPRNPDLNRPVVRVDSAAEVAPEHGDRIFRAVRPGRVILDIFMSACEQPPGTP